MYTKSVKWLAIGDVLAEDILKNNDVIIRSNTSLKAQQILTIQAMGLLCVKVESSPYLTEKNRGTTLTVTQQHFYEFIIHNNQNNRYYQLFEDEKDIIFLSTLFNELLENETVQNLLSAIKLWDLYSAKHAIDTFIIGTLWLNYLDWHYHKEDSIGFLLHDIGKVKVPRDILYKKGELTSSDAQLIQKHPQDGANILRTLGFSPVICEMANYHHVRLNNTGYPKPSPSKLHDMVKILMIVDVFSALTLDRPYQSAVSFDKALEHLRNDKGAYDQELLNNFIAFIQKRMKK